MNRSLNQSVNESIWKMNDFRVLSRVHFRVQDRALYKEHSSIVCRGHFRVHLSLLINRLLGCSAGIIGFFVFFEALGHENAPGGPKGRPKPCTGIPGRWANFGKKCKKEMRPSKVGPSNGVTSRLSMIIAVGRRATWCVHAFAYAEHHLRLFDFTD